VSWSYGPTYYSAAGGGGSSELICDLVQLCVQCTAVINNVETLPLRSAVLHTLGAAFGQAAGFLRNARVSGSFCLFWSRDEVDGLKHSGVS
jgi:hypothetical protein